MHVDPLLSERLDTLFASLIAFVSARFGDPGCTPPAVQEFLYQPWKDDPTKPTGEAVPPETLRSIFAGIPGVVIKEPSK